MPALHITFGLIIALLLILAVFLFFGKGTIFISGMMYMPKEARDKVNKKALGRFVSIMLFIIIVLMAVMWVDIAWLETKSYWLTWVATGLIIIGATAAYIIGALNREKWFKATPQQKTE